MTKDQQQLMLEKITEYFGYNISSRTRRREVSDIRHIWRYVMRKEGYTSVLIAEMTGHDHSSVLHSEKVVEKMIEESEDCVILVDTMKRFIQSFQFNEYIVP